METFQVRLLYNEDPPEFTNMTVENQPFHLKMHFLLKMVNLPAIAM